MELEWGDPPPASTGPNQELSREVNRVLSVLKEYPGRWALVGTFEEKTKADNFYSLWSYRKCQVAQRRIYDEYKVWVRWPATNEEASP